jgi:hypothetical protein
MKTEIAHGFDVNAIKREVVLYKGEAYTYFDEGLTRIVFVNADKTKVIKFLVNEDGFNFNKEEAEIYDNAKEEHQSKMARTVIDPSGIIEQEYCERVEDNPDRAMTMQEILFVSSCRDECGWTKEGKLVCFDLDEYCKY